MKLSMKELRKARGMTINELADALGVSKITIMSWESGKTAPTINKAYDIADALGVELEDISFF